MTEAGPDAALQASKVVGAARDFARATIAPAAATWSRAVAPDPALFAEAGALGLTRLEAPIADGGLGLGFETKARICEALAGADFGFAMSVVNTHNAARKLAELGTPEQKAQHLPALFAGTAKACTALTEQGAGSDVAAMETTAERSGGGWRLTGEKIWIVNGRDASMAIVYAQTGAPGDARGIGAFLVDLTAPGCRRFPIETDLGDAGVGTGGFAFDGVALGAEALLIAPGAAFKSILAEINGARAYVAAMCCGMLDAALALAAAHGAGRMTFGKPLRAHQAWRLTLARAELDLAAARALTDRAVRCVAEGGDAQRIAAEAKAFATEAAQRRLPELLHAMGAEGFRAGAPFVRHLVAAQTAALVDGSTEMLLERIAHLARPAPSAK